MGLQKHMILKRTKLLKQPNIYRDFFVVWARREMGTRMQTQHAHTRIYRFLSQWYG